MKTLKDNISIAMLFPDLYQKMSLRDRIEKFIKPDDYDWAIKFCISIISRSDYEEVRKNLKKINLEILIKYHYNIQQVLDSKCSTSQLITYINSISELLALARKVTSNEISGYISRVSESLTDKEIAKEYDNLYNTLKQPSNNILDKTITDYINECVTKFGIKIYYFQPIIINEIKQLSKYLLEYCIFSSNNHNRKIAYNSSKNYVFYRFDMYTKIRSRKNKNMPIDNHHREGKYLVRR